MIGKKERNYLFFLLLLVVNFQLSEQNPGGVTVEFITPSRGGFSGGDIVQVYGSGFKTFSSVTCIFNDRWAGFSSEIYLDTIVKCQVPQIEASEFDSLPIFATVKLIFDGDNNYSYDVTDQFLLGPTITSIYPLSGYVEGGNTATIFGTNFGDFQKVQVYFDSAECTTVSVSSTEVQCTVPAGEFNQNALITLVFDQTRNFYVHATQTYHYGPLLTEVTPGCGSLVGGTYVTITGENLDDPSIALSYYPSNVNPLVELSFTVNEDDDDSVDGDIRYFGILPTFDGTSIVFETPSVSEDVFGKQIRIFVVFKESNAKVAVTPKNAFRYGPIVYNADKLPPGASSVTNPTPSQGHYGGGDTITITGCGFSQFPTSLISPMIVQNGVTKPLCSRGSGAGSSSDTLKVASCSSGGECEQITCVTATLDCNEYPSTDSSATVYVQFTPTGSQYTNGPYYEPNDNETSLYFTPGPQITAVSQSAGYYAGGETVTLTGSNLFASASGSQSSPGWSAVVYFGDQPSTGVIVSDSTITCVTPSGIFNTDVSLTVDFLIDGQDTNCIFIPRSELAFHYGPLCSSLSPSNGYLSGNTAVVLTGSGFTNGYDESTISIRVCLDRLNADGCDVYENPDDGSYTLANSQITFITPSYRKNVVTNVGGNRIFGDTAGIYLYYSGIPSGSLNVGSEPLVYCGDFRFGPVVSRVSPNKGPMGPAADNSPNTPVQITGSGFSDSIYDSNVVVSLGEAGATTTSISDTSIGALSNWGGYANEDVNVNVLFNPCNTTSSGEMVHWGPEIISLTGPSGRVPTNTNGHIYGVLPEGGQSITIHGNGFSSYITQVDTTTYVFNGECLIDGVSSSVSVLAEDSTFSLVCETPARPFGTEAPVTLKFGYVCDDSSQPADFRKQLTASQKVFYTPRIDSFSPTYGLTTGGTTVTISGEGFIDWDSYSCYFGHYTNGILLNSADLSTDGTTVICQVPYHRGEFNTDVTVHVELNEEFQMKAWAPSKYHYGPVCTDISPNNGYIAGNYSATITGDGFVDCATTFYAPFYNCTFTEIQVVFVDNDTQTFQTIVNVTSGSVTNTSLGLEIPSGSCMFEPLVQLYFPDVFVSTEEQRYVTCENTARSYFFHYGPLYSSQNSTYYRSSVSYGWQGDIVSINGINFADPSLSSPSCVFGSTQATVSTLFSDTQIQCVVPSGTFDDLVNVTLEWSTCVDPLDAEYFHYGPVLDSITPTRGYVLDRTVVTITGFAFECCGITSYSFLWPDRAQANAVNETTYISLNTVTAPVPNNTNIDAQIEFIGVQFNSTLFTSQNYLTHTEANGILTFYYGPYVYDITPTTASLSGRGESITIQGEGFLDPYFTATYCDFISTTDGNNDIGTTSVTPIDDNTIICPLKTFNHVCGDIDDVRPRWDRVGTTWRQELGTSYYKTEPGSSPVTVISSTQKPFWIDNGSITPVYYGPLVYGANILSITEVNQVETSSYYNSPIDGGLELLITFDSLDDWISNNNDFGSQTAMCKFGNRYSDVVSIQNNTVTCVVPPLGEAGDFSYYAEIEVILNPQIDSDTILSTSNPNYHWHWLPYASKFSKSLVQTAGREVITIDGAGFCDYYGALCLFGSTQAIEADITNDYTITCETPQNAPGTYDVTIQLCSDADCATFGTPDIIPVDETLTVAGVTGMTPLEGSLCGGSVVTLSGFGFSFYDYLTCRFGNEAEVDATVISDNTLTCVTPDLSPLHPNTVSFAECSQVTVLGKYGGNINFPMAVPVNFEFGTPFPTEAVPSSADVDVVTEIVVNGKYFGGGDLSATYYCKFGDLDPVEAQLYAYRESDTSELKYSLICYTPSVASTPSLTVGDYDLEIQFACGQPSFSTSRVPFRFTQNPRILSFSPAAGTEIGGTIVEIKGRDLDGGSRYFCSFGTLNIDNQIVSAYYDSKKDAVYCETPAHVVNNTVKVDLNLSIDGGETWVLADNSFEYVNAVILCEQPFAPDYVIVVGSSSVVQPSFILLVTLSIFSLILTINF